MSDKIKYSINPSHVEIQSNRSVYTGYSGEPVGGDPDWVARGSNNDYYYMMEGIIQELHPHGSIHIERKAEK
tara:strand:+ start:7018 stop:7233 length:216 start_codon:yes stop_codon:yes gene_type:complete